MPDRYFAELTSEIVAAFVARNQVTITALPDLIRSVHGALRGAGSASSESPSAPRPSAAQIRKSIEHEFLTSFEDGRKYRMLRRHLRMLGMTPEEYRAKWGLPADYPMTAPAYSARRSEFAKAAGLGSRTRRRSGAARASG